MAIAAIVASAAALVGLLLWATVSIVAALRQARDDAVRQRTLQLFSLFAPGVIAAQDDPRTLLGWQPLATTARGVFPEEFAALDDAAGATFPFSIEQIQAAHARWTAIWLSWESAHDSEYRLKAAALEEELGARAETAVGRARLESVAREKLERYQRQYEDYTRVSKVLRALGSTPLQ
jgi:hypothetical protein